MLLDLCFTLPEIPTTIFRKKEKRYFQREFISRDSYYERKMELFSSFLIMVNIFKGIL